MHLLLYTCLTWVVVIRSIFINESTPRQPNQNHSLTQILLLRCVTDVGWADFFPLEEQSGMKQAVKQTQACEQHQPDRLAVAWAVRASGSWLAVLQQNALSHMHTHWQVISVSDRMQAKPFSVFIHLPYTPFWPSLYAVILRCSVTQWHEAPGAQKPVAQWQLTFDSLSQKHHHTALVCIRSSSHCQYAVSPPFIYFFYFVALLPTTLCDSDCWLKLSPLKLAVPVSPLFSSDPKAGETFTWQLNVCNHPRGCSGGRPQGFCVMGRCVKFVLNCSRKLDRLQILSKFWAWSSSKLPNKTKTRKRT